MQNSFTNIEKCCQDNPAQSLTGTVDVLFVTDQPDLPHGLIQMLHARNLTCCTVRTNDFAEAVRRLDITGAAVLYLNGIPYTETFFRTIEELQKQGTAVIIADDGSVFPFERFELVFPVFSATTEEIWGRIDTALIYRRKLRSFSENTDRIVEPGLLPDTLEQLRMAGEVQKSFLPSSLPDTNSVQWAVAFRPADWVSGDIYDVARLDESNVGFYIADAVGHSMPAALLTMFVKHAISMRQTIGSHYRIFEPGQVIANLNTKMVEQELAGCLFATCCYCLLNINTFQLSYARAGHPYPVLLRQGKEPQQLLTRGGLLGVFPENEFEQGTLQLERGDKLFLYSDGAEGLIGGYDEMNEYRFSEWFSRIAKLSLKEMLREFEQTAQDTAAGPEGIDDITAVGLEIL